MGFTDTHHEVYFSIRTYIRKLVYLVTVYDLLSSYRGRCNWYRCLNVLLIKYSSTNRQTVYIEGVRVQEIRRRVL